MAEAGTFPFGWVRGVRGENWQIIWNPRSKSLVAVGASSGEILPLGESPNWEAAKIIADSYISAPDRLISAS